MQLEILRAIQSIASPALDVLMECVTVLGESAVIMLAFCAVYWCVDKKLGRYLAASMCASVCFNGIVKDFAKAPRPIGEPGIISHRVETATGYSFPSGHTQSITAFCASLFLAVKKTGLRAAMILLPLLVGFSRLYLGVHYPADVLGGLAFGWLVSLLLPKTDWISAVRYALVAFAATGGWPWIFVKIKL